MKRKKSAATTTSATEGFRRDLLRWFASNDRSLPWRGISDPYGIWVSEIMLQQTTSAVGLERWPRFMERFPTLAALAAAPLEEVLHEWSGLGYYARARNLHRAALMIMQTHDGKLPRDLDALKALPGLGDYTAAAVASIAFGVPAPVLDANVERVITRIAATEENPRDRAVRDRLRAQLQDLIDPLRPGDFNEAMMDLGALVCTPHEPHCTVCPVSAHCRAFELGRQEEFPRLPRKVSMTRVQEAAVVIENGDARVLVLRRPRDVSFGGMWELPRVVVSPVESSRKAAARASVELTSMRAEPRRLLLTLRHTVMRRHIQLDVWYAHASGYPVELLHHEEARWVTPEEWLALPRSSTQKKIAEWLAAQRPSAP